MISQEDLIKGTQFIGDKKLEEGETPITLTFDSFDKHGDCKFIPSDETMCDEEGGFFLPIHIAHRILTVYNN